MFKRLYVGEILNPIQQSGIKNMYTASFSTTGPSHQYPKRLSEMYSHMKVHKIVVKFTPNFTANTDNSLDALKPICMAVAPLPTMANAPITELKPNDTDYTYSALMNLPYSKSMSFKDGKSLVLFLKPRSYIATGQPTATTNLVQNGRFSTMQKAGWMSTATLNPDIPKYYDDYLASYAFAISNFMATGNNNLSMQVDYYAYVSFKNDRSVIYEPYKKSAKEEPIVKVDPHAVHGQDF